MRKLGLFVSVSLDGYFADENSDVGWAHGDPNDAEWNAFVGGNASSGGVLLLGRVTYQLMASYWPTPQAHQRNPAVADGMNTLEKVVFSRTVNEVSWSNTTLMKGDLATEVRRMKNQPGGDIVILGSGSIASQLAQEGLIDEFQMVVVPILLGKGRMMFAGIRERLALKLTRTRAFGNGNVLLNYGPRT